MKRAFAAIAMYAALAAFAQAEAAMCRGPDGAWDIDCMDDHSLIAAGTLAQISTAQADDIDPRAAERYRPSQAEAVTSNDTINPELPGIATFAVSADIRVDIRRGYRLLAAYSEVSQNFTACVIKILAPNGNYTTAPEGACLGKLAPVMNETARLNIKSNGLPAGTSFVLVPMKDNEVVYPKGTQYIGAFPAN